jgi:hypothetical protein
MPTMPAARMRPTRSLFGLEHLTVGCLVGEERELREDEAQGAGDEQLEPRVTQQDEARSRAAECEREDRDDGEVEPAGAVQESGLANDPGEGGVTTRDIRVAGAGLRRPDRTEGFGVRDVYVPAGRRLPSRVSRVTTRL